MVYAILTILLIAAITGWAHNWFTSRLLIAWMVMNRLRMPDDNETKLCADVVKRNLFRKKK